MTELASIKQIKKNKKKYLELLLLGDEQEYMIDKYLERGEMFTLFDKQVVAICVVTDEGNKVCELKNIAVIPEFQGKGYGTALIKHINNYYSLHYSTMIVGTGDNQKAISFYQKSGFKISHRIKHFFINNYDHAIIEDGKQLDDMVYLSKELS